MPPEFNIYHPVLFPIAVAVLGLLLGSFLNVCIYRIPRDLSVVSPRSFCPECGQQIAWYDNVPLVSYSMLRGRCRHCGKAIRLRYPMVEIVTACLFAAAAVRYGWTLAALKWMIFEAIVLVLFWTDFEEQILPDEFTLGGAFLGLIIAVFVPVPSIFGELFFPEWKPAWQSLLDAVLGGVVLSGPIWLLGAIYVRVRKREGLGLGDVKLLLLMGVFLGAENGLRALLIGTVAGSVIGLLYVFWARKRFSDTELPFGSFLCAGAALVPLLSTLSSVVKAGK